MIDLILKKTSVFRKISKILLLLVAGIILFVWTYRYISTFDYQNEYINGVIYTSSEGEYDYASLYPARIILNIFSIFFYDGTISNIFAPITIIVLLLIEFNSKKRHSFIMFTVLVMNIFACFGYYKFFSDYISYCLKNDSAYCSYLVLQIIIDSIFIGFIVFFALPTYLFEMIKYFKEIDDIDLWLKKTFKKTLSISFVISLVYSIYTIIMLRIAFDDWFDSSYRYIDYDYNAYYFKNISYDMLFYREPILFIYRYSTYVSYTDGSLLNFIHSPFYAIMNVAQVDFFPRFRMIMYLSSIVLPIVMLARKIKRNKKLKQSNN